jgi:hypothetical protein
MANLDDVVCTSCKAGFRSHAAKTFLGFKRYVCTACESKVVYPLGDVTRVVYWVVAALFLVLSAFAFASGGYAFPGLLMIGATYGLIRDHSIRKQVRELPQPKWR